VAGAASYIDMPLQHINDEMLKKMRRRVTRRQTEQLLEKLRKWVPEIVGRSYIRAGGVGGMICRA
jgi:ribosomal protein S12 methylthiotransferase